MEHLLTTLKDIFIAIEDKIDDFYNYLILFIFDIISLISNLYVSKGKIQFKLNISFFY